MTPRELASLARELDLIDFGMLEIDEENAFLLMASHVLELNSTPIVDKAVITKLLVENFVLNLQLLKAATDR